MAISKEEKQRIIETIQNKLKERQRNLICPICGNNGFILAEGYAQDGLQEELVGLMIGGPSIPVVIVVCNHCGNVIRFSLGVLGLLPQKGTNEKGKDDEK